MSQMSLEKRLENLNEEELFDLILSLREKNFDLDELILEWLKKNKEEEMLDDDLLLEYWNKAQGIISEFNFYGGGSRDKEDEAYGYLYKIFDLIEEENIITEMKIKVIDGAIKEYKIGNSGFVDILIELCFGLCESEKERRLKRRILKSI
ncbi:hypothetical protein MWH25_02310 [Natroniella acetigena]|uniref:hypothetical protein n=1 Tax=Natroniella acetigena TaxID=52004 RepID=UPI00200B1CA9|nr:hypothetical protein [Natroniella acetigena]MCK8826583.1 hypothetical protein [Natroniella acetigena]